MRSVIFYIYHRLQGTLTERMNLLGYRENAPENVQEEDERNLMALLQKLDAISECAIKLDAILDAPLDPMLSLKISGLCKMESWPDMSMPGHAAPLAVDQGAQIEERFLAFLKGKIRLHFPELFSQALL